MFQYDSHEVGKALGIERSGRVPGECVQQGRVVCLDSLPCFLHPASKAAPNLQSPA
jgi:hypothetical protein